MKRIQIERKHFYFSINGPIYRWTLEIGRFSVAWEKAHWKTEMRKIGEQRKL